MTPWPLKFRRARDDLLFFANDAGGFFISDDDFLCRYATHALIEGDRDFLVAEGHAFQDADDLSQTAFAYRWAQRQNSRNTLAYLILVPTLRCNLACTYCQVSRAAQSAVGYDWSEETLADVCTFLDALQTDDIKVEFQGGEPFLRIDLLIAVRDFCRQRFQNAEFVVCTNLQSMGPDQWAFLEDADTFVSTSIDGQPLDHDRNRTQNPSLAEAFFNNVRTYVDRFGSRRLSALPTIDVQHPPDFEALIDTYEGLGLRSIYLRPVNYQGFARRTPPIGDELQKWNALHSAFVDRLVERNFRTGNVIEEFYFTHCLKRVLRAGHDGHVDLRNPSPFASDYIVVDYDGRLFPTDEARMMARVGQIDLSIGSVKMGIDRDKVDVLNASALNNFDPDCIHCAYQPFCGSDPIDAVSRYGRVDLPKSATWFCGRHLSIFDRVVRLLYSKDKKELFSLAAWAGVPSWPAELAPVHQ